MIRRASEETLVLMLSIIFPVRVSKFVEVKREYPVKLIPRMRRINARLSKEYFCVVTGFFERGFFVPK